MGPCGRRHRHHRDHRSRAEAARRDRVPRAARSRAHVRRRGRVRHGRVREGGLGALHADFRGSRCRQQGRRRRARDHQRRPVRRRLADQAEGLDRRRDRQAHVGRRLRRVRGRGRAGKVKFLPTSDAERAAMLGAIGVKTIADQMLYRAEWLTSYTPYQPEVSQGTLQSIFEFQTHLCLLTGLEVANASLYEGASALVEALLMADRLVRNRRKAVLSRGIHPEYRETVAKYFQNLGLQIVEVPLGKDGSTDAAALLAACDDKTFAVAVQSPNFHGVVEDWSVGSAAAKAKGALSIAVVAEAISLALLAPPGECGV